MCMLYDLFFPLFTVCNRVVSKRDHSIDSVSVKMEQCPFTFEVPTYEDEAKPHSESEKTESKTPPEEPKPLRPLTATRDRLGLAREKSVVTKVSPSPAPSPAIKEHHEKEDTHGHNPSVRPRTATHEVRYVLAREDTILRKKESVEEPTTIEKSFPLIKYKLQKSKIKAVLDSKNVAFTSEKDRFQDKIKLTLKGKESNINAALVVVYEAIHEVQKETVHLDKEIVSLVQHDLGKKLQQHLESQRVSAQVTVLSGEVHVYAVGDCAPAVTVIKDAFSAESISAKVGSPPLSGSKWDLKKKEMEFGKELVIKEVKGSKAYLQLSGYKQAVNDAKTIIELFVKDKKEVMEKVDVKYENVFRYLTDIDKDAFQRVKQQMK